MKAKKLFKTVTIDKDNSSTSFAQHNSSSSSNDNISSDNMFEPWLANMKASSKRKSDLNGQK